MSLVCSERMFANLSVPSVYLSASQLEFSQIAQNVLNEATSGFGIFSLMGAGSISQLSKLSSLKIVSRFSQNKWAQNALSSLCAVAVEGSFFHACSASKQNEISLAEFGKGALHSSLILGGCKITGGMTQGNFLLTQLFQSFAIVEINEASGGILIEHENGSFSEKMIQAAGTSLPLFFSAQLLATFAPGHLQRESKYNLTIESEKAQSPSRSSKNFFPSLFSPHWVTAEGVQGKTTLQYETEKNRSNKMSPLLMMESLVEEAPPSAGEVFFLDKVPEQEGWKDYIFFLIKDLQVKTTEPNASIELPSSNANKEKEKKVKNKKEKKKKKEAETVSHLSLFVDRCIAFSQQVIQESPYGPLYAVLNAKIENPKLSTDEKEKAKKELRGVRKNWEALQVQQIKYGSLQEKNKAKLALNGTIMPFVMKLANTNFPGMHREEIREDFIALVLKELHETTSEKFDPEFYKTLYTTFSRKPIFSVLVEFRNSVYQEAPIETGQIDAKSRRSKIIKFIKAFRNEQGRIPTPEEISLEFKTNPEETYYILAFVLNRHPLYLDAPLSSEENRTGYDRYSETDSVSSERIIIDHRRQQKLTEIYEKFARTLSSVEVTIFKERLLVDFEDQRTLQDIATQHSLTRERIRQIEGLLRTKLRIFLVRSGISSADGDI